MKPPFLEHSASFSTRMHMLRPLMQQKESPEDSDDRDFFITHLSKHVIAFS